MIDWTQKKIKYKFRQNIESISFNSLLVIYNLVVIMIPAALYEDMYSMPGENSRRLVSSLNGSIYVC